MSSSDATPSGDSSRVNFCIYANLFLSQPVIICYARTERFLLKVTLSVGKISRLGEISKRLESPRVRVKEKKRKEKRKKNSRQHVRDTRNTGGKFASKYRRLLTDRSPRCAVTSGTRQPRLSRYKSAKLDNARNFRAAPSSSALKILRSAIRRIPPPARQK